MEHNAPQNNVAPTTPINNSQNAKGLAITALVVGVTAFLASWTGVIGLILAIVAIIFGTLGLVKHQRKGMSITGLILGGIALLAALFFTFFYTVTLFSAADEVKNDSQSKTSPQDTTKQSSWDFNTEYNKIKTGMARAEVESAINKTSDHCTDYKSTNYGTRTVCNYGNYKVDKGGISVTYLDDKVDTVSKYSY